MRGQGQNNKGNGGMRGSRQGMGRNSGSGMRGSRQNGGMMQNNQSNMRNQSSSISRNILGFIEVIAILLLLLFYGLDNTNHSVRLGMTITAVVLSIVYLVLRNKVKDNHRHRDNTFDNIVGGVILVISVFCLLTLLF